MSTWILGYRAGSLIAHGHLSLQVCVDVLFQHLEHDSKIAWEDLRFMFGEIFYGGHITDDWDRRVCAAFLNKLLRDELLLDMALAPSFLVPSGVGNNDFYQTVIRDTLPSESPELVGLPLSADVSYNQRQSEELFLAIYEMQPKVAGASSPQNTLAPDSTTQRAHSHT